MDLRLADRKLEALSAGCALFSPSQSWSAAGAICLRPNRFSEGVTAGFDLLALGHSATPPLSRYFIGCPCADSETGF